MSHLPSAAKDTTTIRVPAPETAPSLARWTALCAAAEGIGMTAAAAAAKTAQILVGEPSAGSDVGVVLGLAVAGGLVEGLALGMAQASGLSPWLPHRRRIQWVLVTAAVAGIGWTGASTPAALAGEGGTEPSLLIVLVGAAGIGLVMGTVLGAAQAMVLRHCVPHPWRWVTANAAAWLMAMPVIFFGATTPGADWSLPSVIACGAATGMAAGAALGVVTGWFLPSLAQSG